MRLKDKVAIVTGAGSGNGAAIAAGLAREGARVVFADLNREPAEMGAQAARDTGGRALSLTLDVSDPASVAAGVERVVGEFGTIDILVNNAGIITRAPFLEVSGEEWDRVMAVNAKGVFLCSQAVARHMAERKSGAIVNITSFSAFVATPNVAHYGASKGAVHMLTKHMALDLAQFNIRVNAVAPGVIETNMNRDRLANPTQREASLQRILLGRVGSPEDLVGAVVYLASEDAAYVTGTTIHVDGGWMVR
jgi:NAD(P)-dependent dehydrogenase (short-subunit alcohol dehydrogenase family)